MFRKKQCCGCNIVQSFAQTIGEGCIKGIGMSPLWCITFSMEGIKILVANYNKDILY